MRPARELLRDYIARRRAEGQPPASPSAQEESLRRLLRHVGAARQPSEQLEARLLEAMCRTARQTPARPSGLRAWPRLSPQVWRLAIPAAGGAVVLCAMLWSIFSGPAREPARVASGPKPAPPPVHPAGGGVLAPRRPVSDTGRPLIGYVLLPEGDLLRRSSDAGEWEPVEGGDPVHLGDALRTESGSAGSVVFLDGSDCQMGAGTSLRYSGDRRTGLKRPSRVHLTRGQLWVRAEKGGPEFRVVAPAAAAVVQGTVFGVTVDGKGATALQVTEGKVRLQNARGTVLVSAGRESLALVGEPPRPPLPIRRLMKLRPAGESGPSTRGAAADAGAKPRTVPTTPGSRSERGSSAPGKPKRHPTIESYDPRSRPLKKRAPQDKPEKPPSAPIDSSGSSAGSEPQTPVATDSP